MVKRVIATVLVAATFVLGASAVVVTNDSDRDVVHNAERER